MDLFDYLEVDDAPAEAKHLSKVMREAIPALRTRTDGFLDLAKTRADYEARLRFASAELKEVADRFGVDPQDLAEAAAPKSL